MTQLRIFLDKKTRLLSLTTHGKGDIYVDRRMMTADEERLLSELEPHFDRFSQLHIAGDLSRMVQDIIESMHATAQRPGGGIYFVPYAERTNLKRLKDLIEVRLPPPVGGANTSYLLAYPVNDEPNTKAQVVGVSHAALLAEVEALSKDLDRFIEQDAKKPGTVKINSMQSRMSEYTLMKGKLEFYAETLGMHQDQVKEKLSALELQAKRLIDAATNAVSAEMDTADAIS